MKVSLPQIAAKVLPTKTSHNVSALAESFSAALADIQGFADTETPKLEGVPSNHGHKNEKVNPREKDDKKSSAPALPSPKLEQAVPPATLIPAPLAAPKPEVHEKATAVATTDREIQPDAGTVSPSARSAGHPDLHYAPTHPQSFTPTPTQAPIMFETTPSFGEELRAQVSVPVEPTHASHTQMEKVEPVSNHVAIPSPANQVISDLPIAVPPTSVPAMPDSPEVRVAENLASAVPMAAALDPAREVRATRPAHHEEPSYSAASSTFQASFSALHARGAASEDVQAATKPVVLSSSSTTTNSRAHQDLPHDTPKGNAAAEAVRPPSVTPQGPDVTSHTSHHGKSDFASSGATTDLHGRTESIPMRVEDKSEVPPAAQLSTITGSHGIVHDPSGRIPSPAPSGDAHPLAAAPHINAEEGPVSAPGYALHAAKLVERLGQSEFRVGLHAGEFGKVDIRTTLARNQVTAEISVERGELGRALTAELPALHTRLSEQHFSAANITVQDYSAGASADQQQSRENRSLAPVNVATVATDAETSWPAALSEAVEPTTRLDIHM